MNEYSRRARLKPARGPSTAINSEMVRCVCGSEVPRDQAMRLGDSLACELCAPFLCRHCGQGDCDGSCAEAAEDARLERQEEADDERAARWF